MSNVIYADWRLKCYRCHEFVPAPECAPGETVSIVCACGSTELALIDYVPTLEEKQRALGFRMD